MGMTDKKLQIRNSTAEFLIFTAQSGGQSVEVHYENDTIWLTQKLMAALFQVTPQNITQHLKSIYQEGELNESATCKDFLQVQMEGKRDKTNGDGAQYFRLLIAQRIVKTGLHPLFLQDPPHF
jgi:hypothetical protein